MNPLEDAKDRYLTAVQNVRSAKERGKVVMSFLKAFYRTEDDSVATTSAARDSVIEAYSRQGKIEGMDQPHVAGIMFPSGKKDRLHLRVSAAGQTAEYKLDRWD